jgi:hypothetical protein
MLPKVRTYFVLEENQRADSVVINKRLMAGREHMVRPITRRTEKTKLRNTGPK